MRKGTKREEREREEEGERKGKRGIQRESEREYNDDTTNFSDSKHTLLFVHIHIQPWCEELSKR